jgi:small-conductance mechanosensitive channel
MAQRRIVFEFRVTYDTKVELLERIPRIVRAAVETEEKTRFDRAHWKSFGVHSLEFEVVYFVLDSDYNVYMDIQQAVNLTIMRELQSLGVRFAFPTMMLKMPEFPDDQNPDALTQGPQEPGQETAEPGR